jgi:hypothetical protein
MTYIVITIWIGMPVALIGCARADSLLRSLRS